MELIEYLSERGAQARLAKKLGVSSVLVHQWAHGKRQVPAHRCLPIEKATDGKVQAARLRPDVFGDPVRTPDEAA